MQWDAYPVLPPTSTFPPIKLAKGLYYVNAFEPYVALLSYSTGRLTMSLRFISTMETETISARNVVELLLQEEFNASICKRNATESAGDEEKKEDFVYGWDC